MEKSSYIILMITYPFIFPVATCTLSIIYYRIYMLLNYLSHMVEMEEEIKSKEEFVARVILKLLFHPGFVKIGDFPGKISSSTRHRAMEALCEVGLVKKAFKILHSWR